jgi:putative ABC transport system permease protein
MFFRDLLYAGRTLRKSPIFAITAILTIGLGIGASTAIFSVANAVLLRPLPYDDPQQLVLINMDLTKRSVRDLPIPNADFIDLRNATRNSFEDIAAIRTGRAILPREDQTPEQIRTANVTPNFFRMMGGRIVAGRDFIDADGLPQPQPASGAAPNTPPPQPLPAIAILSYEYWQRRFGGNTNVFGRGLLQGGTAGPQVVGVVAPGFELQFPPNLNMERLPDIWVAARIAYDNSQRNTFAFRAVGRLKSGVAIEQAQHATDAVSADLRKNFNIKETAGYYLRLEPLHKYVVAEVQPAILAMMGAVIFLLLIACANVANLLLVRASVRERELAVRTALGGSWWALIRQMLAEALLISGLGTIIGVALAWAGIRQLLAIAPANLPRLEIIQVDLRVLMFAVIAGLISAVLFGIMPALRAARPDVMQVLRGSGRTAGLGGGRLLRNAVVIAEVALSFVLLIGSGLMIRSFVALQRIQPGYDSNGLLTFQLLGGRGGPQPQQRAARMREIQERLRALPGVQTVTAASPFPLADRYSPIRWGTEPALSDPSKFQAVDSLFVLPGYFEAMRTPLLAGRTFTEADNAPERAVVVVDDILAAKAYPNESVVGKRILIRQRTPEPEWVEIIGVVAHHRGSSLIEPGREQVYFADGFVGHGAVGRWALRTTGDPASLGPAVRAEIARIDRNLLINELQPMDAWVQQAQAGTRFSLLLIGVFAVIAVLLASVGLYGVLSTVVRQRTAEIGVRMALGAAPGTIFNLVVGQGIRLSAIGVLVGIVAAFFLTRVMRSMLVGVTPTDPITFWGMAALFFATAVVASWLPARRAASLDPNEALREE